MIRFYRYPTSDKLVEYCSSVLVLGTINSAFLLPGRDCHGAALVLEICRVHTESNPRKMTKYTESNPREITKYCSLKGGTLDTKM